MSFPHRSVCACRVQPQMMVIHEEEVIGKAKEHEEIIRMLTTITTAKHILE
jgi:hypothetical protein